MKDDMVTLFQGSEATNENDLDLAIAVSREGMHIDKEGIIHLLKSSKFDCPNFIKHYSITSVLSSMKFSSKPHNVSFY